MSHAWTGLIAPDWAEALRPVDEQIARMDDFLRQEAASGTQCLPAHDRVMRAFAEPLADVKVLIVGQDPYPTPGHPIGLSFSVAPDVRPLPRSLNNIYAELRDDIGIEPSPSGDLSAWSRQGVLLLNRVLSVRAGEAASHRRQGWEAVTDQAITALVARQQPLVAILWGKDAARLRPLLGDTATIESSHPSPLSARHGFFGSRPFSRANDLLAAQGARPVDWDPARQGPAH